MPGEISLNLSRNISVTLQYQTNAINRSGLRTQREMMQSRSQNLNLSPQDIGSLANESIQGAQAAKTAQSRLLDTLT